MIFGPLEFEARYKCNNEFAYCRNRSAIQNGLPRLSMEDVTECLLSMREYFKDKLGVKDEC